jgi:hypothetical protein
VNGVPFVARQIVNDVPVTFGTFVMHQRFARFEFEAPTRPLMGLPCGSLWFRRKIF